MIKFEIRLKNALSVIDEYDGKEPLHHFLSNFYKRHKQMGSKDRRFCSDVVYAYFRLGNSLKSVSILDKIYVSLFLFSSEVNKEIFKEKFETFYETIDNSSTDKIYAVKLKFNSFMIENTFPANESISKLLNSSKIIESIFSQPNIFIRIAEKDCTKFVDHLAFKNIVFKIFSFTCLGFEPRVKLHEIFDESFNYEVQDFSSQQTGLFLKPNANEHWLDCCAASGGKSLLLVHNEPTIDLTVVDIRKSSIENLKKRFAKNGITKYKAIVADVSKQIDFFRPYFFDGIIADVPCTGSGTWARNPENLTFFNVNEIEKFAEIQFSIIKNVVQYLKANKPLIYITCSVFEQENEAVVEKILNELPLKLKTIKYINGIAQNADTMFCAVFEKQE
jgi:16S rRNA (cytosine967-C5)-methyltransferase